jgi:hypothetical protein
VQVWSAAAFLDPVKEAERVQRAVVAARDARLPERGGVPQGPSAAEVPAHVEDPAPDVIVAPVVAGAGEVAATQDAGQDSAQDDGQDATDGVRAP